MFLYSLLALLVVACGSLSGLYLVCLILGIDFKSFVTGGY